MPTQPTSADPPLAESNATNDGTRDRIDDPEAESGGKDDAVDATEDRFAALERRVTDLEAELEAVRGLLDGVGAVDEAVERRASAALAKAESLEKRLAPENDRLVRERLPEAGGDDRRGRTEGHRTDRRRTGRDGSERETGGPRQAGRRDGGVGRGFEDRVDPNDASGGDGGPSPRTPGRDRTRRDGADTGGDGPAGAGAISSVGPGGSDEAAAADPDRSLAARLRDVLR